MKGKLHKKLQPEGWYVVYSADEFGFAKSELPLHPDYVKYYFLDEDAEGSEVEFESSTLLNPDTGIFTLYAKLKRHQDLVGNLKEHLDSITPEQFNKEIDDIIAEQGEPFRVWECCGMEECICEQTEITDEEIQKEAQSQATFAPSFIRGVEWYKEQLKKGRK